MKQNLHKNDLRTAAILFGIGMGGFIDGILFHQILQVHNMLSNRFFPDSLVNIDINMFWDGLFHAATWIVTAVAIYFFWRAGVNHRTVWSGKTFIGGLFLGWGLFNFVEGVIDHHILQVHHVVQRATGTTRLMWDLAFLASGIVFIVIGSSLIKTGKSQAVAQAVPKRSGVYDEAELSPPH